MKLMTMQGVLTQLPNALKAWRSSTRAGAARGSTMNVPLARASRRPSSSRTSPSP